MSSTSSSDMPLKQRRRGTDHDSAARPLRAETSKDDESMKDHSDDEDERVSENDSSDEEDNVPLAQRVSNGSGTSDTA